MDCGIPFCHEGCPLGNLIPEWNDLVYRGRFAEASDRLHATNNFPEFTGRLCPAPCEGSCVLGIIAEPVLIKQVELEIAEWAAGSGVLAPRRCADRTRQARRRRRLGAGRARRGAAAHPAGHAVVVFERAERIGGLLRYGIPEFKLEKSVLDRRLAQMVAEGTEFRARVAVGTRTRRATRGARCGRAGRVGARRRASCAAEFDAIVLAAGCHAPARPRRARARASRHPLRDGLPEAAPTASAKGRSRPRRSPPPASTSSSSAAATPAPTASGRCTARARSRSASSRSCPSPEPAVGPDNPWPTWPVILRTLLGARGGGRAPLLGRRRPSSSTTARVPCGRFGSQRVEAGTVDGRPAFVPVPGSEFELEADLVLIAMGFSGPRSTAVWPSSGSSSTPGATSRSTRRSRPAAEGSSPAATWSRGQSLIVWAIAEGRSAAAGVDRYLTGRTDLPAPIVPGQLALR